MKKDWLYFLTSTSVFTILVVVVLFSPFISVTGWKLSFLVGLFLLAMPIFIYSFHWEDAKPIFWFSFMASLFQIFPDWFLAEVLGVLVFPDEAKFSMGKVPFYMAGMWTIPFFISLVAARLLQSSINFLPIHLNILTGIIALLIFWISEETMHHIPVWYPQNVKLIGSSAIYVLPAEFFLGIYLSWVYEMSQGKPAMEKICLAGSVFIFYTGALSVSYLIVERLV